MGFLPSTPAVNGAIDCGVDRPGTDFMLYMQFVLLGSLCHRLHASWYDIEPRPKTEL